MALVTALRGLLPTSGPEITAELELELAEARPYEFSTGLSTGDGYRDTDEVLSVNIDRSQQSLRKYAQRSLKAGSDGGAFAVGLVVGYENPLRETRERWGIE